MDNNKSTLKIQGYESSKQEFLDKLCGLVSLDSSTVLNEGIDLMQYQDNSNYNIYVMISKNIEILRKIRGL